MADYDEDGRNARLLPCGQEEGDCSAAGFGCDGCGNNEANSQREEYKCPVCRDTGLGPYDGMRCPACSPGGKAWRERMSGDDARPGPDDGKEE